MELCSFGKDLDHCGSVDWAKEDCRTIPLLSCKRDLTAWLQQKYKGSGASGARGRPTIGLDKKQDECYAVSEWELIMNRAGLPCSIEEAEGLTVCPKHRFKLTTMYKVKDSCCYPDHNEGRGSTFRKRVTRLVSNPRRVNKAMAELIFDRVGVVVPIGSGICSKCRQTLLEYSPATPPVPQSSERKAQLVATPSLMMSIPRRLRPASQKPYRLSIGSALSVLSSSSQEEQGSIFLPEGEKEVKNLQILNNALALISDGDFEPLPRYVDSQFEELSEPRKKFYTSKAEEVVMLALSVIAPGQSEQLWEAISSKSSNCREVDVALEAILLAYEECENKATKTQILSLISDKYSQSELQQLLPGVSLRQIKNARKHTSEHGRGEVPTRDKIFRCRLDMTKVKDFIDFISRSTFLQDVAFGTKTLKLTSGTTIPIPGVIRTMTSSKIVYLYREECKTVGVEPLKEHTCRRILDVCSASKQKSLQGLDNTSTAGSEAFETLKDAVENLANNGAGFSWARKTVQALNAGKQYLKAEYKTHLGKDESCADHCTVYALSDPVTAEFASTCDHEHNSSCPNCQALRTTLAVIKEKIEDKSVQLTEKQRDMARWDFDHAASEINSWKAHLLRTYQQDLARQDALASLDNGTVLIINDWAMKIVPMRYRETQSQWFGKRGLSWHFSAVIHKANHPDCTVIADEYQVHTYVAVVDNCKQDWHATLSIIEEVLVNVKDTHQAVTKAILRSDNAGCYHNGPLLSSIHSTSKRTGVEVVRYDFSDPQAGKDLCDRKIAPCKQRLRNYVDENHNIETARGIKEGLESPPGIAGTRVAVCNIDSSMISSDVQNNKIPGISKLNNFSFNKDGTITAWQAYNVGEGITLPAFQTNENRSGLSVEGEWSKEPQRRTSTKKVKGKASIEQAYTFACMEPACIATFSTLEEVDKHMDCGIHVMKPEREVVYDTIKRQWAAAVTNVKGKTQKVGECDYQQGDEEQSAQGWALKKPKSAVRIAPDVKDYLMEVFNDGTKDGYHKANPKDVAEDIKQKFPRTHWLESQTIKSFFSRMAAAQRNQPVRENDDDTDDGALDREQLLRELAETAQAEVNLQHPIMYKEINLCELYQQEKLEKRLKRLKLSDLSDICSYFIVDITGSETRKDSYVGPLLNIVESCICQKQ